MATPTRPRAAPFLSPRGKGFELVLGRSFALVLIIALLVLGATVSGQPIGLNFDALIKVPRPSGGGDLGGRVRPLLFAFGELKLRPGYVWAIERVREVLRKRAREMAMWGRLP